MSVSAEVIQANRDLALELIDRVGVELYRVHGCGSGQTKPNWSKQFVKVLVESGRIAKLRCQFIQERSAEFVGDLCDASCNVARPENATPEGFELAHDWSLVISERYLIWLESQLTGKPADSFADHCCDESYWRALQEQNPEIGSDLARSFFNQAGPLTSVPWGNAPDYAALKQEIRAEALRALELISTISTHTQSDCRPASPRGEVHDLPDDNGHEIDRYEVGKLAYEHRNVDDPPTWPTLIPILNEHFGTEFTKTTVYRCMEEYCGEIGEPVPKQSAGARKKKPGKRNR